ncbi:HAD-IA family hydrolase [Parahaliea sp. F7430]|uniref:HAD-IA family hydrolase n=1 Tax=Sediminihaliea albiluteola TaxID=2758564 RepID=A0A7W2YJD1_9GAMM|nr:HAD-IA family hydrolase [Sediminihaliea albiluteola]MBA6412173.1 HAD-IA family hydrolase [Sediminihaliea albiluteola]
MIVIFDWDGTLCDSIDGIVQAMQAAAQELSIESPEVDAVRNIVGLGLPQAVQRLFPDKSEAGRLALAEAYSRQYIAATAEPVRLFDGAREMLENLRQSGFELAVATGKSRRGLNRVLAGLAMEDYFDATRCADETKSKPDPLMLREILAERGFAAEQAWMVGDSEYDLAMAAKLGMPSVGVSFGVHSPERLRQHNPRHLLDELGELPELLLSARA